MYRHASLSVLWIYQLKIGTHRGNLMQQMEIRIKGRIDKQWSDWLGNLSITYAENGETVLTGLVRDQAALYGLLNRLSSLGLQLNSVNPSAISPEKQPQNK
jgi:hypothetical protein